MRKALFLICAVAFVIGVFFVYRTLVPAFRPALFSSSRDIGDLVPKGDVLLGKDVALPLMLPPEFRLSLYAEELPGARVMAFDPNGTMLVTQTGEGMVTVLFDRDHDGFAEEHRALLVGLNRPHGLAFHDGYMYVAEEQRVRRYQYIAENSTLGSGETILDLPADGGHFTRTIGFGPPGSLYEGKLFVAVGSSCNVCKESDERRARILIADADGTHVREFARGLRNSVFFDWHPVTHELFATDMGRDWLGDDIPPDEVNIIREGLNYGWPICYGNNIHDASFDKNTYIRNPCQEPFEAPPYVEIPAHSAPLGIAFTKFSKVPDAYRDGFLVAYHGSWNRSEPTGYKVVYVGVDDAGKALAPRDFITGWIQEGEALGRPVDIKVGPAGAIYISDDKAGVLYQVSIFQK